MRRSVPVECVNALVAAVLPGCALVPLTRRSRSSAHPASASRHSSTVVGRISRIRAASAKTTPRAAHDIESFAICCRQWLLLDSPGMRELKISDAAQGITEMFDDVTELARTAASAIARMRTVRMCRAGRNQAGTSTNGIEDYRNYCKTGASYSSIAQQRHRTRRFAKHVSASSRKNTNALIRCAALFAVNAPSRCAVTFPCRSSIGLVQVVAGDVDAADEITRGGTSSLRHRRC